MYFKCPNCKIFLDVPENLIGTSGICIHCHAHFTPEFHPSFFAYVAGLITRGRYINFIKTGYKILSDDIHHQHWFVTDLRQKLVFALRDSINKATSIWKAHIEEQYIQRMMEKTVESLDDVEGVGRGTLETLKKNGYHTLLDLVKRPQGLHQMPRVATKAKKNISSYVTQIDSATRSIPPRLSPDNSRIKTLVELMLEEEAISQSIGQVDGCMKQLSPLNKRYKTVNFLGYLLGVHKKRESGIREAANEASRLSASVASLHSLPKYKFSTLSQNDFIRGIELIRKKFLAGQSESVLGSAAAAVGVITGDLVKKIEAFDLDVSSMQNCILRKYQEFGAKFLLVRKQCFLGDEMGLGKTIQTLAAVTHLHAKQGRVCALAIVPASLKENWKREVEDKTQLSAYFLQGYWIQSDIRKWRHSGGVAIMSYASLRGVLDKFLDEVSHIDLVIVDEAQYIKNPGSQRTRATRKIMALAEYAVVMTGTPIENHPKEFMEVLRALKHGLPKDSPIWSSDKLVAPQIFQKAMRNLYLRRNKEDVLDELPELIEQFERVEPERKDLKAHLALLDNGAHFMTIRQDAIFGQGTHSAKLERARELIEEYIENGRKVVVFTFFKRVLQELALMYPEAGTISGGIAVPERMRLIDEFSSVRDLGSVLLVQIKAGGVGLNMQAASAVIIVEPQLNPAIEYQAICRVHRMGQRSSVNVHRLITCGTIEESLVEMLMRKRQYMTDYARDSLLKDSSESAVSKEEIDVIVRSHRDKLREELKAS